MRILHLSTSQLGGAGKSAAILNKNLQDAGVSSWLLTRPSLSLEKKVKSKVSTFLGKLSSTAEYDFLSSQSISTLDFKILDEIQPQVIHVHNWYNLISVKDFSRLAQIAPLVFTLHDERLATGGCHVTLGCKKFLESCDHCPAHQFRLSREEYRKHLGNFYKSGQKYSIISPSLWMIDQFKKTELLANAHSTAVIPNHLSNPNPTLLTYKPKPNLINLIFIASNLDTPYKGLRILLSALSILDTRIEALDIKVNLKIIGDGVIKKTANLKNIGIVQKGHLSSDVLMNLMEESDILVVPSLSENYPGVIAEGQAHGIRVVAHRVGGISEMIVDGVTGYLCEPNDRSLAEKILEAILDANAERVRVNAFQEVLNRQNSITINTSHLDFYTKILERKNA